MPKVGFMPAAISVAVPKQMPLDAMDDLIREVRIVTHLISTVCTRLNDQDPAFGFKELQISLQDIQQVLCRE